MWIHSNDYIKVLDFSYIIKDYHKIVTITKCDCCYAATGVFFGFAVNAIVTILVR